MPSEFKRDARCRDAMGVDEKCPVCGNSLKYVGKSSEHTAHGHHARKFECTNKNCPREVVYGGWANE